jgi:hypothetical protein
MSTANAAAGKIGQSLYFKRSPAQYIVLASSTLLEYNAPFSYSVWVNPADIPSGNGADCMHYYPVTSADAMGWGWDLTVGAPFAVPSRFVLELGDAISGISRVPSQAARSIG